MQTSQTENEISTNLLAWYAAHKRDLPWRRTRDAYAVWVSEIMLQQTTVAAVTPFYERWMARFPTVTSLAAAPLDDVLKLWAGLGYYARARNFHKAAQQVVAEFGGVVPSDPAVIRSLPGIGRYTAGAILSIAYGADEPVVDANVIRVLCRLFAVEGDPKTSTETQAALWSLATDLLPKGNAAEFNQAIMELGALVCNPALPLCWECPLVTNCAALAAGSPMRYPKFQKRDQWVQLDDVAVAVRNARGEIMLAKRSASESLWGGLWELPRATRVADESLAECAVRAVRDGIGVEPMNLNPFGVVNHVVAKRKITLHGFVADCNGAAPQPVGYEEVAWEPHASASRYAMSTPQVRLLSELSRFDSQGRLDIFEEYVPQLDQKK